MNKRTLTTTVSAAMLAALAGCETSQPNSMNSWSWGPSSQPIVLDNAAGPTPGMNDGVPTRMTDADRMSTTNNRATGPARTDTSTTTADADRDRMNADRDRISAADRDRLNTDRDRPANADRDRLNADRDRTAAADRDRVNTDRDRTAAADRDRMASAERDRMANADRDRVATDRDRAANADRDRTAQANRDRMAAAERDRVASARRSDQPANDSTLTADEARRANDMKAPANSDVEAIVLPGPIDRASDRDVAGVPGGTADGRAATRSDRERMDRATPANRTDRTDAAAMGDRRDAMTDNTAMTDATFVREAAMTGMKEIEASRLALEKSQNADVRTLAQMMIDDHGKASAELKQIARDKGMTLPDMPMDDATMRREMTDRTGTDRATDANRTAPAAGSNRTAPAADANRTAPGANINPNGVPSVPDKAADAPGAQNTDRNDAARTNTTIDPMTGKAPIMPANMDPSYTKLKGLSGADFDREYTRMMVMDHEKAVAKFEKQARDGQDADLKAFAGRTAPTLRHHLDMSRQCLAKVDPNAASTINNSDK